MEKGGETDQIIRTKISFGGADLKETVKGKRP